MNNVVLTLGGVAFKAMEVPQKINLGGKQRLSVSPLIGGGKFISALGYDDGQISFSGVFSGTDAVSRTQLLDAARSLGSTLPLIWDGFYYLVIISQFSAEYQKTNFIPFTIRCEVVNDPISSLVSEASSVASLISADIDSASALSGQAGLSISGVSQADLGNFLASGEGVGAAIAAGGNALITGLGTLNGIADVTACTAAMATLVSTTGKLAALTTMNGYLSRAAVNIGNAVI